MLNSDELHLLGIKCFHLFGISEGKNQRQRENFFEKNFLSTCQDICGRKINGLKTLFTDSEFQRGKIQPLSKKTQNIFCSLIKAKVKTAFGCFGKNLSSKHYYNSHIAFWHDFGDNRKNIFLLRLLPRRTQRTCQTPMKDFRAKEKRTGTSACPRKDE